MIGILELPAVKPRPVGESVVTDDHCAIRALDRNGQFACRHFPAADFESGEVVDRLLPLRFIPYRKWCYDCGEDQDFQRQRGVWGHWSATTRHLFRGLRVSHSSCPPGISLPSTNSEQEKHDP